ncbi:hypothetical protein V6582_01180 (plasmid) [Agrobacterium vitis]|uniref:hypothetical protein n=1 Tax=Agrobacterium vitis TaxID=373 RepID=UPI0012E8E36B|nr:hypothetical protein [Agrobacterium vitis]MVA25038.1 hypothetical protein [Agrobacterium vitis]
MSADNTVDAALAGLDADERACQTGTPAGRYGILKAKQETMVRSPKSWHVNILRDYQPCRSSTRRIGSQALRDALFIGCIFGKTRFHFSLTNAIAVFRPPIGMTQAETTIIFQLKTPPQRQIFASGTFP